MVSHRSVAVRVKRWGWQGPACITRCVTSTQLLLRVGYQALLLLLLPLPFAYQALLPLLLLLLPLLIAHQVLPPLLLLPLSPVAAQWKSLLTLLLGCEDAPLRTHQAAFAKALQVIRAQLSVTLGGSSRSASGAAAATGAGRGRGGMGGGEAVEEEEEEGQGEAPFGLPMIEELLPDSFLRKAFGRFFQILQVRGGTQANGWGCPGEQEQRQGGRAYSRGVGGRLQQAGWVCAR